MALNLNKSVVEILKLSSTQKLSAKEIAQRIFDRFPGECEEKRRNSRQNLSRDSDLIQQISAEIAANRPKIQRQDSNVKTTETRPIKYYYSTVSDVDEVTRAEVATPTAINAAQPVIRRSEADLYPLLSIFIHSQQSVFPKRIDDRVSSNSRGPNGNRWLFPDVVGMEDFGVDWTEAIKKCVREYGDRRVRLWSFEVKILLNRSNVREAWFQTVSNSSWANFGYLVACEIATDAIKELRMLSAAHGIGVIRLDADNPAESEIIIPAREKNEVDWDTCNRLVEENRDFKGFVDSIRHFHQTGDIKESDWDIREF
jgi:uncharacterized protein